MHMEAPKCRLCGKRHWGMCPEPEGSEGKSRPLTNAEHQKRYRERHGESYRKRNRERMRGKRK